MGFNIWCKLSPERDSLQEMFETYFLGNTKKIKSCLLNILPITLNIKQAAILKAWIVCNFSHTKPCGASQSLYQWYTVEKRLWSIPSQFRISTRQFPHHKCAQIHIRFLEYIKWNSVSFTKKSWNQCKSDMNPCPAEPGYILPLQTLYIQISWLLKKPTDLDLHCLPFSIWIYVNNVDQVSWLAEN